MSPTLAPFLNSVHLSPTCMPREASEPPPAHPAARRILLGLLVAALMARLAAALLLGGTFHFVDEAIYVDAAGRLRSGAGLGAHYDHVPGYPAILAILAAVSANRVVWLRLAQAALAALGCILCFGLGRRLGGDRAGLAAAGLYALDPLLVVSAALLYPEAVAGLLLSASLLAAWEAVRRDRLLPVAMAGLLLGILALLRPVGLALTPVMLAWVGLAPGRSWGRRTVHAGLLGLAWAAALLPWTYRNYRVHGRLVPVAAAGTGGVTKVGTESDRFGLAGALSTAARRDPVGFARRTAREFGGFWEFYPTRLMTDDSSRRAEFSRRDPRLTSAPVLQRSLRDVASAVSFGTELALAAVGLLVGWRTRRRETVWLVTIVLAYALGYALFYGKLRYRIPILPVVLSFAGLGAAELAGLARWRTSPGTSQAPAPPREPPPPARDL
jgi:4-amino-4-deoxy-L-arabinose transferase-like glycosyltransferase